VAVNGAGGGSDDDSSGRTDLHGAAGQDAGGSIDATAAGRGAGGLDAGAAGRGAGPLALVGSGEYLPVMLEVERSLIAGRPPRYVQIPTAAAPEGPAVLAKWRRLGEEQAARLGVEAVPLLVRDRAEADDPAIAAQVRGAGLVYLSGGNPAHLAASLRGTALWREIVAARQAGAALAGCSAGAMAMTARVPHVRALHKPFEPGLDLLPHLRVIPHFDKMLGWAPDLVTRVLVHAPEGVTVLGIDEDTALVGGPEEWQVIGRQSVWTLGHGARVEHPGGTSLVTPAVEP
jgi:peptidase E